MKNLANLYKSLSVYFFDKNKDNVIGGDILPKEANAYKLGSPTKPFAAIYADTLVGAAATNDGKVKIDSADTTIAFLDDKLLVGSPITKTINSSSGSKTMTIDISTGDGLEVPTTSLQVKLGATSPGLSFSSGGLQVDSTVVRTTRTISTGNGLTGGGDLSANRTISVDLAATNPGLEFSSSKLTAKTSDGITRTSNGIVLDLAYAAVWTGLHTFNASINMSNATTNTLTLSGATNTISLSGTTNSLNFTGSTNNIATLSNGSIVFAPNGTGSIKLGGSEIFESNAAFSQTLSTISGFKLYDLGSNKFELVIGSMKVQNFYAQSFIADSTRVTAAKQYWTIGHGVVQAEFTLPAINSTVDVWFEDNPGLIANADIFAVGDFLQFRYIKWTTGLVYETVWMEVISRQNASDGSKQRWRLNHRSGGTASNVVPVGTVMVDYGQGAQTGWIEINALNSEGGPFVQVGNWNSSGANKPYQTGVIRPTVRIGNLYGIGGVSTNSYGLAVANNLNFSLTGSAPNFFSGFVMEPGQGFKFFSQDIEMYYGYGDPTVTVYSKYDSTYGLTHLTDTADPPTKFNSSGMAWATDLTNNTTINNTMISRFYSDYENLPLFSSGYDVYALYAKVNNKPFIAYAADSWSSTTRYSALILSPDSKPINESLLENTPYAEFRVRNTTFTKFTMDNTGIQITGSNSAGTANAIPSAETGFFAVNASNTADQQALIVSGAAGRNALRLRTAANPTVSAFRVENSGGTAQFQVFGSGDFRGPGYNVLAYELDTIPGSTTPKVLTVDITLSNANRAGLVDIWFEFTRSASAADFAFVRQVFAYTYGNTGTTPTIRGTTNTLLSAANGITITGVTAITNGFRWTFRNDRTTGSDFNRNAMHAIWTSFGQALTVSQTVA